MKFKVLTICLIVSLLPIFSSFDHPLKLTTSLIEYDSDNSNLKIECRVFIDDFGKTLNRENLNASSLTKEDIGEIEYYFDEFYRIVINGEKLTLNYKSSKAYKAQNVLSLKFSVNDVTFKKGDALMIENKLFFTDFGPLQSNKMTLRIPPFLSEGYYEATLNNYTANYQF